MKVLFVDDNSANRLLMERLLTSFGYSCSTASNGKEALQQIRQEPFDVVLSDILMPQMDGFQLCREIRQGPQTADLPVVFCTATYTDPEDRKFALSLGAHDFLTKPVDNERLVHALQDAARRGQHAAPCAGSTPPDFYESYSARLVHRLEGKLEQLTAANLKLEQAARLREQADARTQKALELLRATFDSTVEGLIAVVDDVVVAANGQWSRQWGMDPSRDLVGMSWTCLVPQLQGQLLSDTNRQILWLRDSALAIGGGEVELVGGQLLRIDSRPLAVPSERWALLVSCRDVTAERSVEARREEYQRQIAHSQKIESVGLMAASVAHDFNNLLMSMGVNLELLARAVDGLGGSPESEECLRALRSACQTCSELVHGIVGYSRKETSGRRLEDLGSTVRQAAQLLSLLIPSRIELRVQVDPSGLQVIHDPVEIQQVVLNLGANAMAAMPEGGVLSVQVKVDPVPANCAVVLSVSDSGVGIRQSDQERIFEAFYTTKPEGTGTGLGLSTVHRIVTAHGGDITVQSSVGQGTAFRIVLPQQASGNDSSREQLGRLGTLLVIERDLAAQRSTRQALEQCGFDVLGRSSERESLDELRRGDRQFAAVLLDDPAAAEARASELAQLIAAVQPRLPIFVVQGESASSQALLQMSGLPNVTVLQPRSLRELTEALERGLSQLAADPARSSNH